MRKILLFLGISTFFSFTIIAQNSFQIVDLQSNDISNDTVTVIGSINDNEVDFYAHVINTSASNKSVICKKTVLATDGTVANFFCIGPNCYSGTSSSPVSIQAGVEDTTFHAYVYTSSVGVTRVLYTIYDTNNMADSVNVLVKFDIQNPSALQSGIAPSTYIGKPYPLPANEYVQFDYHTKQGEIAAVVIYDVLGTEVGRYFLSSNLDQIKINTSEYETGVFIYMFLVNGKKVKIGRMMVKH